MAIPTYLPAPEQPGWPNLPDQGIPLVNAVATAVSLNNQREQVQGRLAQLAIRNQELEANEGLKEKYYNLALEKVGMTADHNAFMADYNERKLRDQEGWNRETRDIAWERADIADRQAKTSADRERVTNQKLDNKTALDNRINDYAAAIQELEAKATTGQGPRMGTPEYGVLKAAIDSKYSDTHHDPSGMRVYTDSDTKNRQVQTDTRKAYHDHMRELEREINWATRGGNKARITGYDLQMPIDKYFGTTGVPRDGKKAQSWLARDDKTGKLVLPEDVNSSKYPSDKSGLSFTTLHDKEWKTLRKHVDEFLNPDGEPRTISNSPAPITGPSGREVKMIAPNGDTGMVDINDIPRFIDKQYRFARPGE